MFCEIELRFLWDLFEKCHLQMFFVDEDGELPNDFDMGLRRSLGLRPDYERIRMLFKMTSAEKIIFRVTDPFYCSYLFLFIPERKDGSVLCIGPYLAAELGQEQIMELGESLRLSSQGVRILESWYTTVPLLSPQMIHAPLETFCDRTWGKDSYTMVDVNSELTQLTSLEEEAQRRTPEETEVKMWEVEQRYAYENELLDAVRHGQFQKAERLLGNIPPVALARRLADPVRSVKNFCIISNTLMRKAAEEGGVHPLYLHEVSSSYAVRIEELRGTAGGYALMVEMTRDYCWLVQRRTMKNYSRPVQRAVIYIEANLGDDLSLRELAARQGMHPGYLSTVFRKETGQTLTEYITEKRMAQAMRLLTGTKLQIQTIAQQCGIPDVNYFSKVFKKHRGLTPRQFREESLRVSSLSVGES